MQNNVASVTLTRVGGYRDARRGGVAAPSGGDVRGEDVEPRRAVVGADVEREVQHVVHRLVAAHLTRGEHAKGVAAFAIA